MSRTRLLLVREADVKYSAPKAKGKTMHIRDGDAEYIEGEGARRSRANADQIAHIRKLYQCVVQEIFGGNDDFDTIQAKLREWKRKSGEGK